MATEPSLQTPSKYPKEYRVRPIERPINRDFARSAIPGSKSITNRALLLASLADGESTVREALFSDDTHYMSQALIGLGVPVESDSSQRLFRVQGKAGKIPVSDAKLFVGNAGTAARFLTAFLALGRGRYVLDGSERMRERPIGPLLGALNALGVEARSLGGNGCPPVEIRSSGLRGGVVRVDGRFSSQYLSALLLVGAATSDGITIEVEGGLVSRPFIDLTLAVLRDFGVLGENDAYRRLHVMGGQVVQARDYSVEPDATAASYAFALGAASGGAVRVEGLGRRSVQGDLRFCDVLSRMGCSVQVGEDSVVLSGPDYGKLRGGEFDLGEISDTALTLAAIAPLALEPVTIRGIAHTRHQECDRIAASVTELRRLGVSVDEHPDGLTVHPARDPQSGKISLKPNLSGGLIRTYDDHRVAMSFTVLGVVARETNGEILIENPACVAKTFPGFFDLIESLY